MKNLCFSRLSSFLYKELQLLLVFKWAQLFQDFPSVLFSLRANGKVWLHAEFDILLCKLATHAFASTRAKPIVACCHQKISANELKACLANWYKASHSTWTSKCWRCLLSFWSFFPSPWSKWNLVCHSTRRKFGWGSQAVYAQTRPIVYLALGSKNGHVDLL
jgi:hypothetical protein